MMTYCSSGARGRAGRGPELYWLSYKNEGVLDPLSPETHKGRIRCRLD